MRILFVHQNFPAQFRHVAPQLVARGHEVVALTMNAPSPTPGTRTILTTPKHGTGTGHPWTRDFDTKIIRGEATLRTAMALKAEGFVPDLILAHPGWGDTLFLKDVWPSARLAIYCEFFYAAENTDVDFDPEFDVKDPYEVRAAQSRLRNMPQRMHFDIADAGLSPTRFQANTYPAAMRERIMVCHDGIDTEMVRPGPAKPLEFSSGARIEPGDELVTFVNRNLEPYRGYHTFMRALPEIMARRPKARVLIVGRDGVGYGAAPKKAPSWKQQFLDEVRDRIDMSRVFFVGMLDYPLFLNVLRVSTVHVYLTYPFVLSWSLMEAMATQCAIVASDTAPVREFIEDGRNGLLTSFFDPAALAERTVALLGDADLRQRLGATARADVIARADLRTVALPRLLAWIDGLLVASPRVTLPPV